MLIKIDFDADEDSDSKAVARVRSIVEAVLLITEAPTDISSESIIPYEFLKKSDFFVVVPESILLHPHHWYQPY